MSRKKLKGEVCSFDAVAKEAVAEFPHCISLITHRRLWYFDDVITNDTVSTLARRQLVTHHMCTLGRAVPSDIGILPSGSFGCRSGMWSVIVRGARQRSADRCGFSDEHWYARRQHYTP